MMKTRFAVVVCALFAASLVGGALPVEAGVVEYIKLDPMTADADSGISASNYYTHLLDFGTGPAATVNTVPFTQVTLGNVDAIPGFSYGVSSAARNQHGGNANTGVDALQGINELVYDMLYNGNNDPGGVATITLSGLVPDLEYETRLYNRRWEPGQEFRRSARFEFDTDGVSGAEDSIEFIDQNDASLVPPSPEPPEVPWAPETANAMAYRFTAESTTMTIAITQNNLNYSWHIYGLTNEEVGIKDPLTWDGLGDGNWNSTTQWTGGAPGATPDLHTDTTVVNNRVTVTTNDPPAEARSLTVSSGHIAIDPGLSLRVAYEADFFPGTTLTMGAGSAFSARYGSIPVIDSAGDTSVGVTYHTSTMTAVGYTDGGGAPRVFTKTGDGTLAMDNSNGTDVVAGSTTLRIEEGTLDMTGGDPLGGATAVTLAGGGLTVRAGMELVKNISTGFDDATGMVIEVPDPLLPPPDPDYTITPGPETATVLPDAYPVGGGIWMDNSDTSKWIGFAAADSIADPGNYDFTTTVSLDGEEASRVWITGGWTSDNIGLDVFVNGTSTGAENDGNFAMLHSLGFIGGGLFQDGANTVSFRLNNVGTAASPAGLRADAGVYLVDDFDLSSVTVTVDGGGTLDLHSPAGANVGPLVMKAGSLTTSGVVSEIICAGTTVDPTATAVGFDPRVPTDFGTITNNSTQPEVVISKNGPGTWRLDEPLAGTTGNVLWRVEDGTLELRGNNTLSGRPITVADGTLDVVSESSLGAASLELAGGRLLVEGDAGGPGDAPDGAIAHYAFDSAVAGITPNDGTAGSVLDGVVIGGARLTSDGGGVIGEAMQFGASGYGNGYVEVGYDAALGLEGFTVSAWVNIDSEPAGSYGILGTRIGGDTTFDVKVRATDIHGDVGTGTAWINTNVDIRATDTGTTGQGGDLGVGEWHLVTYVIGNTIVGDNQKQFDLYVDGDLKRTIFIDGTQTPLMMKPGQSLWIGDDYAGHSEYMQGLIDEVYIYGSALDAGEVATLWGNGYGPNDGTAGVDMSNTDLLVSADSVVEVTHAGVGGIPAPFGELAISAGVLTTMGPISGISFAGTSIPNEATAVGFDPRTPTDVGVIDAHNAAVTISKMGPGDLVLDDASVNLGNATFDVQEGRLIGVPTPIKAEANPFGAADMMINGGELVLAGHASDASVLYDNAVTVAQNGTVTAGAGGTGTTGVDVTLGSATSGVTIGDATTLTLRSSDGYALNLAGAVSGPAGTAVVNQGEVTLSGGGAFQALSVSGDARANTAVADVTVDDLTVGGNGLLSTDAIGVTVNDGGALHLGLTDYLASSGSFNVSGSVREDGPETLTLLGGTVTISVPDPDPTGMYYVLITNDADSGISTDKTYTHAIDFGSSGVAIVNGVAFVNDFNVNGNPGSENVPIRHGGDLNTAVTGDIAMVFQDMDYNANPAEIILTGLTDGQVYDFRLYNRSWAVSNRSQRFDYDVGNDGSIEETVTLNPDDPTADPPGFVDAARNIGYAMSYVYTAGALGELKLSISQLGDGTYHLYGLTNEHYVPPPLAPLNNLAGTGTVVGEVVVEGTVAPGSSAGVLSFGGGLELGVNAAYDCEIAEWADYPTPPATPANDELHMVYGDAYLDGELKLAAVSKLAPAKDLGGGVTAEQYGDQTRTIISAEGESSIAYYFATVPTPQPEEWYIQDVTDPDTGEIIHERNWDQGHLGYGVFLTRLGDWGANALPEPPDPLQPGLSYARNATQTHLFQAADGDTNGDRNLNSLDIQNILSLNKYLTGEPANWIEGNFNAHDPDGIGRDVCDSKDIQLLLATALWNTPQPYSEPPELKLAEAEGVAELVLAPGEDGRWNLQIDTHGLPLTSYVIHSAGGALSGRQAANLGMFQQDDDNMIGGAGFGVLIEGIHDLGDVIGPAGNALENLSFTYTVEGRPGVYEGRLAVVPEPGTLVALITGAIGLLLLAIRRRRTA